MAVTMRAVVRLLTTVCSALLLLVVVVDAKAILGIDLGSLYMKVALVQRGAPLEIVTNLHSKRKTEHMILFDNGSRLYGADASSLLARKPLQTPSTMSVMLGKPEEHPTVQILMERHYPLTPFYNATRGGLSLTVDKQEFTPEELVAMVLQHAKDIAVTHGDLTPGEVKDVVLTVPCFATQHERRALLDAARLADLNVLALIDETAAAALQFGMDKVVDTPEIYIFYNLGASALQVCIVRYFSHEHKEGGTYGKVKTVGALEVLSKAWDSTLGGTALDHLIVEHLADEFNHHYRKKDVRSDPRSMTKLRLQANKIKHVLSANTEMPIYIDALLDDVPLQSHMTRDKLQELAHVLMERSVEPIQRALQAANLTLDDIHGIELLGGGMRVPRIQQELSDFLPDSLELGMHLNSDESMALGAAFYGANISTAFKVRHVGFQDVNPFGIDIALKDLEESSKKSKDEPWSKSATMFKSFGKLGVKKTIAFTHDKDVHCSIDYQENEFLPEGTSPSIEQYNIKGVEKFAKEMDKKGLGKPKVSLQFELNPSGITQLIKAEAAVEETVMVEEEEEVDDNDDDKTEEENATASDDDAKKDDEKKSDDKEETKSNETKEEASKKGEASSNETESDDSKVNDTTAEKEPPKKKKKTIMVQKEKKKIHKQPLDVESFHVGRVRPYWPELMAESKAKLAELERKDKERIMLEEARNKVESYIYLIKNKLVDYEEDIAKVSSEAQREEISKLATDAEDWMYDDGYAADLATMEDKYAELAVPAEKIFTRMSEMTARPEAMEALKTKLARVEDLMKKWETEKPQVTEDERADVLAKVEDVRKWMSEMEEAQAKADPTADPVYKSEDVPSQTKSIEALVARLNRKPKPKPEKKNETKSEGNETKEEGNEAKSEDGDEARTEEGVDTMTEGEDTKTEEGTDLKTEEGAESKSEDEPDDAANAEKTADDEL